MCSTTRISQLSFMQREKITVFSKKNYTRQVCHTMRSAIDTKLMSSLSYSRLTLFSVSLKRMSSQTELKFEINSLKYIIHLYNNEHLSCSQHSIVFISLLLLVLLLLLLLLLPCVRSSADTLCQFDRHPRADTCSNTSYSLIFHLLIIPHSGSALVVQLLGHVPHIQRLCPQHSGPGFLIHPETLYSISTTNSLPLTTSCHFFLSYHNQTMKGHITHTS